MIFQAAGKGRESLLRIALEAAQDDADREELAKWAAASMYSGGADTVRRLSLTGALRHFISITDCFRLEFILPRYGSVPGSPSKGAK